MDGERRDDAPKPPGEVPGSEVPARRKLAGLAVALGLVGSLVVAIVVFAAPGEEPERAGLEPADGSVVALEPDLVVLELTEPIDGRTRLPLAIRPGEDDRLDREHLEFHGAIGDPVRIYYERDDGEYVARESVELPGYR